MKVSTFLGFNYSSGTILGHISIFMILLGPDRRLDGLHLCEGCTEPFQMGYVTLIIREYRLLSAFVERT